MIEPSFVAAAVAAHSCCNSLVDSRFSVHCCFQEQQRIRRYYEKKVEQYEKERTSIEEDKAQVDRYKQLLIKQRNIMIQLTSRLNERDQSVSANIYTVCASHVCCLHYV